MISKDTFLSKGMSAWSDDILVAHPRVEKPTMRNYGAYPIATSLKRFDLFRLEARHRDPLTAVVELTTAHHTVALTFARSLWQCYVRLYSSATRLLKQEA
jgi:hypothetical protein